MDGTQEVKWVPVWSFHHVAENGDALCTPIENHPDCDLVQDFLDRSEELGEVDLSLMAFGYTRLKAREGMIIADFEYSTYADSTEGEGEKDKRRVFNQMICCDYDGDYSFKNEH